MEHVIGGNLLFTIVKLKKLLSKKDIVKNINCDAIKCVKDASLVTKPVFFFNFIEIADKMCSTFKQVDKNRFSSRYSLLHW